LLPSAEGHRPSRTVSKAGHHGNYSAAVSFKKIWDKNGFYYR